VAVLLRENVTIQESLNLGLQHHQAGRLPAAEKLYRQILAQDPNQPDALHLLGIIAQAVGRHDLAVELLDKAIARDPNRAEFHGTLGLVRAEQRRFDESIAEYRKAIALKPELTQAYNNLGNALAATGEVEQAIVCFKQAMLLNPAYADPLYNLANNLVALGRVEEAIPLFQQALRLRPQWPEALNNLGLALASGEYFQQAVECFRQALTLAPQYADAMNNLADLLYKVREFKASAAVCREALKVKPNLPEVHNNLGNALCGQNLFDDAVAAYRNALAMRHDYPEAHNNLGNAYYGKGDIPQAICMYQMALALRDDYPSAHWNLGLMLGLQGDYPQAWAEFERGWFSQKSTRKGIYTQPMWDGGDLVGRRILLHNEQGFGDAIQFARYIPKVIERGGQIVLVCQEELHRLLASVGPIALYAAPGRALPACDVHCPLMLLAKVFGTTVDNIPAQVPYLSAEAELISRWRERMPADNRRKVGLVWAGKEMPDPERSARLADFAPLASVEDVWFCSVQTGEATMDLDNPPPELKLTHWTEDLRDFAHTAALIANLELVITVDTAVAHLAGAMGKPAWVLLKSVPDWRWLMERSDSPWYPTMRLFRQPKLGDWKTPIGQIVEALKSP
jgi:tetratricopeptide (TPR) repeat protein